MSWGNFHLEGIASILEELKKKKRFSVAGVWSVRRKLVNGEQWRMRQERETAACTGPDSKPCFDLNCREMGSH